MEQQKIILEIKGIHRLIINLVLPLLCHTGPDQALSTLLN